MKNLETRISVSKVQAELVIMKGGKVYSLGEPIPRSMEPSIKGYRLSKDNIVFCNFMEKCEFESIYNYKDEGEISDGYHTFNELYEFRKVYNAAFFNELAKQGKCNVVKSKRHNDGEECFGGGWFIVMAELPTGQVSNHYELKDWDLFKCEEVEKAPQWDGHTPQDVVKRITDYLKL